MIENYQLKLITAPATEVVNLTTDEDARDHLKIKTTDTEYSLIGNIYLPAVRIACERYTNRAFFTQTWEMTFDCQPRFIEFPLGNLATVTSVKTYADDGTATTETAGNYVVVAGDNGYMYLESGYTWTSSTLRKRMFKIIFVAGWDAIANIPKDIITAVLHTTAFLYENRESLPTKSMGGQGFPTEIPTACKLLLDNYVIHNV